MNKNGFKKALSLLIFIGVFICAGFAIHASSVVVEDIVELQTVINMIPSDQYGGAFIDKTGQTIINVKHGTDVSKISKIRLSGTMSSVQFNYVKYSLSELEAMKMALEPYMVAYNIASLDANEVSNTIDVELYTENDALLLLLADLAIVDQNIVNITTLNPDTVIQATYATAPPSEYPEEFLACYETNEGTAEQRATSTYTIYPGMIISFVNSATDQMFCTAGPRISSTQFHSVGHAMTGPYMIPDVYHMGVKIGSAASKVLGQNGDRCTITVSNLGRLPATNCFSVGTGRYSISTNYVVGSTVELFGGVSGITSGTVLQKNMTLNVIIDDNGTPTDLSDDVTAVIGGLSKGNYPCKRGDSGGGVFSSNAQNDTSAKCYGIQSAGEFRGTSEVSTNSYFSPIT